MGVQLYPIHVWPKYTNEDYLPPRALELCRRKTMEAPICLYFCPPMADIGPRFDNGQKVINFTMFETTKIPNSWPVRLNKMDSVWNPSHWGKKVFEECGVTAPIEVVPLGVEDKRIRFVKREPKPDSFVFGWMANNINDNRKNVAIVIQAFLDLFGDRPDEPVELWLKTRMVFNKVFPDDDRITVFMGECDNKLMDRILTNINCFLYPSRGEGWGSPPLEAMATGCPTIVTNWSAMTEYINSDICYPLKVKELVKIPRHTGDYPVEFFGPDVGNWAEPDYEHLKELMLEVYTNYKEALDKGRHAYEVIKEEYNYDKVAEHIHSLLQNLKRVK